MQQNAIPSGASQEDSNAIPFGASQEDPIPSGESQEDPNANPSGASQINPNAISLSTTTNCAFVGVWVQIEVVLRIPPPLGMALKPSKSP